MSNKKQRNEGGAASPRDLERGRKEDTFLSTPGSGCSPYWAKRGKKELSTIFLKKEEEGSPFRIEKGPATSSQHDRGGASQEEDGKKISSSPSEKLLLAATTF